MKNIFLTFLTLSMFFSINAQTRLSEQLQKIDLEGNKIYVENNYNNDTLWVCDSIDYFTGEGERYAKHEVLGRNDLGNERFSKFEMFFKPEGISGYSYVDTVTYFNDDQLIEKKSTSVYISSSDKWETSYSKQYEYPDIEMEEIYKFYSSSSHEFNGGFRKYLSNQNGKCDTLFMYGLVNDNDWENQYIIKYYYDEEGYDTLQLYKNWKNNTWVDSVKFKRSFNYGNLIDIYKYRWSNSGSSWDNYSHMHYTYNTDGLVDTIFQENWMTTENAWRTMAISTYTYDENGRYLTTLSKIFDFDSQQLENNLLITDIYDNNNHETTYQYWVDNEWLNDRMSFFSYSDFNKVDTSMSLDWDTSVNEWVPDYRSYVTFDFRNNAFEYYRQNYENNEWITIKKYHYFWNAFFPSRIISNIKPEISVFPNPTNGLATFTSDSNDNKTIKLFSMSGSLIFTGKFDSNEYIIDCSKFDSGVYIYKVFQNSNVYNGKLIVK